MKNQPWTARCRWAAMAALSTFLVACGGGGGSSGQISGTAATGAPITNATVDIQCASGSALSTITSSTGAWQVTLSGQTLPCKLKVSGGDLPLGQALYSVALESGNVNITTLTNLVVASLAGAAPATWFANASAGDFQRLTAAAVAVALDNVRQALPLDALSGVNPLTANFKAEKGDRLDNVLEAIKNGIPDYAALLSAAQGPGASLKAYAAVYTAELSSAFDTAAAAGAASAGGLPAGLSGKLVTLTYGNAQANSPYANGTQVRFTFSSSGMLFYGPPGSSNDETIASFTRSPSGEYTWADSAKQIAFAVSLRPDGSLNEINVAGSASGTPFFGQFRDPGNTTPVADGSGSSKVTLVFRTVGTSGTYTATIQGVAIPSSKAQFCNDFVNTANSKVSLAKGLLTVGTFIVTMCDFSGMTGQVDFNWTSPAITVPIFQTVTYTYE